MARPIFLVLVLLASLGSCSRPDVSVEPRTGADPTPRTTSDETVLDTVEARDGRAHRLAEYDARIRDLDRRTFEIAPRLSQDRLDVIFRDRDAVDAAERRAALADATSFPFVESDLARAIETLRNDLDRISSGR